MTRKVATSVPDELLAEDRRRTRAVDEYVRSYAEHPETDEELEATEAFLRAAWSADDQE